MGKRVAVVGVLQETNTFAPGTTEWGDFKGGIFLQGQEIIRDYEAGNHEISGFLAGLKEWGIEAVPILFAFALPGGLVSTDALSRLGKAVTEGLREAGEIDGVLMAAGGAAVSEEHEDVEGWLFSQVRNTIGAQTPFIATLDPHCHLSEAMLTHTDALLAYRTNPHLDQRERGRKAAQMMVRALRGEITLSQRFCRLPFIINIEKQNTARPPLCDLVNACIGAEQKPGVLDASIILGFPYGDVPDMGSGVLLVSDGLKEAEADAVALRLGGLLWEARDRLRGDLLSPEAAISQARHSPGPVLLLDMGDNIGGGARGDGTWLANRLVLEPDLRSFVCLHDPHAVEQCRNAGVGNRLSLSVGGWSGSSLQGAPLQFEALVAKFPPTHFREEKARHGGWLEFHLGECCLVSNLAGNFKVLLTSRAVAPFSPGLITVTGLRITDFDIITAKGVHGPVGAFGAECRSVIWANTPGLTSADLSHFQYRKRRRPMEPFEEIPTLQLATCLERPRLRSL